MQSGQKVGGGRFTLVQALGRGGMGEVWLARDERLQEEVALKFLPPEVRADPSALDDLRRETARSHRLTHPNIVRIHDFHEPPGEAAFIAMEYVQGWTLAAMRVEQPNRVLSWDYLRPLMQQLCAALDYAHGENVIHRDLKPGNIMVDSRGRLKLADFGIAATVSDSVSRVSQHRATSGTLPYMSPQQLTGKRPSASDDIYALGATLYELLTSKPPFYTGDITHQVLHEKPEPVAERLAGLEIQNPVPGDVAALLMVCLAKEPGQRPQSARAVAGWIGLEVSAKPSLESVASEVFELIPAEATAAVVPILEPAAVPNAGRRWQWVLAVAVFFVIVTIAIGAAYWLNHNRTRPGNGQISANRGTSHGLAATSFKLAQKPSIAFADNLTGTIWMVADSDGENACFQFERGGVLNYEAGRGERPNGKWQQNGNDISISINNEFTILSGTLAGKKMKGTALSRNGKTWTWEATPKS
jgi:hypothetical protein